MEIETIIEHLDWIISELEKQEHGVVYVDHEFFDETIIFTLDKAIEMRTKLLEDFRNNETLYKNPDDNS